MGYFAYDKERQGFLALAKPPRAFGVKTTIPYLGNFALDLLS